MKKLICSVLALMACVLAFVGCTKEDDFTESDLVGTWKMVRFYDPDEGWESTENSDWITLYYHFAKNGVGYDERIDGSNREENDFEYSVNGTGLRIEFSRDTEIWTIESIKSKKMIWSDRYDCKMELKKVSK
ncbi:MAG: lipocalin family protein [Bacteroides sp.]|nr:lipocalin family protein [Bacteroides sp.]MCM1086021.1 lipocalin family protein [Bacteroides sp.]